VAAGRIIQPGGPLVGDPYFKGLTAEVELYFILSIFLQLYGWHSVYDISTYWRWKPLSFMKIAAVKVILYLRS
jgi:hypothetical protein